MAHRLNSAHHADMFGALTMALLVLASDPAPGDEPPPPAHALRWNPQVDIPIASFAAGAWLISELAKPALARDGCRWCTPGDVDVSVRRLFNPSLSASASGFAAPDMASNLVGFAVLPAAMVALDLWFAHSAGDVAFAGADVTIMVEATFSALLLNQVVKFGVRRARPYSVGASEDSLAGAKDPNDHHLSFFSGHSTMAFALATSAGTVALLRGYRWAWITWAVGLPVAATTALLRLAADKHWATDVLVGSAVGSLFGVGVPLLFHGRELNGVRLRVAAAPGGVGVVGRF